MILDLMPLNQYGHPHGGEILVVEIVDTQLI